MDKDKNDFCIQNVYGMQGRQELRRRQDLNTEMVTESWPLDFDMLCYERRAYLEACADSEYIFRRFPSSSSFSVTSFGFHTLINIAEQKKQAFEIHGQTTLNNDVMRLRAFISDQINIPHFSQIWSGIFRRNFWSLLLLSKPAISWPQCRAHLSKSATSRVPANWALKQRDPVTVFINQVLKTSDKIRRIAVQRHDGIQATYSGREIKISPGSRKFSTLRLGHERLLDRGCIKSDANVHNRFKMAATNQTSTFNPRRTIVR